MSGVEESGTASKTRLSTVAAGGGRQERRTTAKVHALILTAAEQLFSAQGYTRTSTRTIAARAGVAEVLLFRHFGSKANLFREAIYQPLVTALGEFLDEQMELGEKTPDPDVAARALVGKLYGMLHDKQGAVVALTGAQAYTSEVQAVLGEHEHPLGLMLLELERILMRYAVAEDYTGLHPPASARMLVATVVGMTVFRTWLLPVDQDRPPDDQIVTELTGLMHHGVLHRPA